MFIPDASVEQIEAFDALQRMSTSPENAARFFDAFNHVDVLHLAPEVGVPTTVLHARGDLEIPFEQSRLLASTIPGARLVSLESKNHILGEQEPAWQVFVEEVRRIIRSLS
jgi:pimeloyl-ACP methyl ester carboxylesterase